MPSARLLAHPRLGWWAVATALVLALPALGGGRFGDDWLHRAILRGAGPMPGSPTPVWDLFTFVSPSAVHCRGWAARGLWPFWMDSDARIALARPLSALTHALDDRIFGDAAWLCHAHSLLWFGAAVLVAACLYRRVHGATATAGLSTVLFALEDAHAMPAAWIANRNALIAFVLGGAALIFHQRWENERARADLAGSLLALALGLAAGEAALGAVAYLVAWHTTMDQRPWRSRLVALGPWLLVVTAWAGLYRALGYGVRGSGVYLDPVAAPLSFAAALPERIPVLLLAQWIQVPVDGWAFVPRSAQLALMGAGWVVVLFIARLFLPLVRARAEARFWALGMLLSTVPLSGAFPMNRLLLFAGIGAFGLLSLQIEALGWLGRPASGEVTGRRVASGAMLALHSVVAFVLLPVQVWQVPVFFHRFERIERDLPRDQTVETQTLVLAQAHDLLAADLVLLRAAQGGPIPARVAVLATLLAPADYQRTAPDTLTVTVDDGWLAHPFDRLLRSTAKPFRRGERIERADFTARIEEVTADGRPRRVSFRFRAPLDDPSFRWMTVTGRTSHRGSRQRWASAPAFR